MGYTHYWTPKPLDEKAMEKVSAAAEAIIGVADVPIAGWDGIGKPCHSSETVSFNGKGDEACETFMVDRGDEDWTFCKTNRNEYDIVVTAMLTYLAAEHGFEVSSDGDAEDWEAGGKLATLALGKTFPNPLQEKVS